MITKRQSDVLKFVQTFMKKRGYAPSYTEIMDGCDLSSKGHVHKLLKDLAERGWVKKIDGKHRAIEVIRNSNVYFADGTAAS